MILQLTLQNSKIETANWNNSSSPPGAGQVGNGSGQNQGVYDMDAVRAKVLVPELRTEIKDCYVKLKAKDQKIQDLETEVNKYKTGIVIRKPQFSCSFHIYKVFLQFFFRSWGIFDPKFFVPTFLRLDGFDKFTTLREYK